MDCAGTIKIVQHMVNRGYAELVNCKHSAGLSLLSFVSVFIGRNWKSAVKGTDHTM